MVGGGFLHLRVAHERAHREGLRAADQRRARVRRAGGDREHAEADGDQRRAHRLVDRFARAREVTAGDVAGFVREHADHFVRIVGREDEAGMDEDVLTAGDERVHRCRR